jgi:hypothetical protein
MALNRPDYRYAETANGPILVLGALTKDEEVQWRMRNRV